ncbi:MAG: glycoside hydrolase family 78 protein [archaeon]|nr:glycoside hydrolase family 78 protein [archaeon]
MKIPQIKLTKALDDISWDSSKWISVVGAPVVEETIKDDTRAADGSYWFVSTLKNEKEVKSAVWMTTGLGVYELFINGATVGDEVLKPGFTHPEKTRRSFTYDITYAFRTKQDEENTLSAQVTPGWWADKITTPSGPKGFYGKKCAFRAVLELTFKDGSKKLYGTDTENWKAGIAGPVKHAGIFDGEEYDARELPGYQTPEKLSTPEENTEFNGQILPTNGAEVYLRHDIALSRVNAYTWEGVTGETSDEYGKVIIKKTFSKEEPIIVKPGETLVVDFGQNCAGVPSFAFNAPEGTTLTCLPSEILNDGNGAKSRGMDGPEGSTHRLNLRMAHAFFKLIYVFGNSKTPVNFIPKSTFFGYRYVSITATDTVTIYKIESIPVTSIHKNLETGTISTGNELVNKLISNTYWGQLSNYLSVSTDCPQRNERLGWTADTQVFTETGAFFANTNNFFHKWLQDLRDTQNDKGAYPGVAPKSMGGCSAHEMMRLGWADAGIIVPWTIWKQFGDNSIIEESWSSMEKYIKHINDTKYNHESLVDENGNYQWADWLSYEPLESCSGRGMGPDGKPLPETIIYWNYLSASYWAIDASMMRDMAAATGRNSSIYESMVQEAKKYLRETFFNSTADFTTDILNTMQTPTLFALKNQLFNDAETIDKFKQRLKDNFAQHDGCLQTGFLGTSILMTTLSEYNMGETAYDLLLQRKNPSWIYSIDNGATTIWERWNSYTKEKGMGPNGMNSFNHYAYGSVCQWIWEYAAGISTDVKYPGFKHIIMKLMPDKRIDHLDAQLQTKYGLIKSSWKYEGDKLTWTFTIPNNTSATVYIPKSDEPKEYQPGTYTVVVE